MLLERKKTTSEPTGRGLKILNLSKVYKKYPFMKSTSDIVALKNLYLSLQEGTLFCLLGHNGAGSCDDEY